MYLKKKKKTNDADIQLFLLHLLGWGKDLLKF